MVISARPSSLSGQLPSQRVLPNATLQAPPMAAATQERRLLAVACRPMLGPDRSPCPPMFLGVHGATRPRAAQGEAGSA
jgi:hypothetical protein